MASVKTFETLASVPLGDVTATFSPIQAGSGDPSPTNIREVSGWDELTFNIGQIVIDENYTSYHDLYALNDSGEEVYSAGYKTSGFCDVSELDSATASIKSTYTGGWVLRICGYDSSQSSPTLLVKRTLSSQGTFTYNLDLTDISYIKISIVRTKLVPTIQYLNGTATVNWRPHTPDQPVIGVGQIGQMTLKTVNDPGSIYAGYLNLNTGVLTATHGVIIFDGTETWNIESTYNFYSAIISGAKKSKHLITCSHFNSHETTITGTNNVYVSNTGRVNIQTNVCTHTAAAFKSYLAGQYENGTPLTCTYELTTPLTYQLTKGQLQSIVGTNHLWSTANVSVDCTVPVQTQSKVSPLYYHRMAMQSQPHLEMVSGNIANFKTDIVAPIDNCIITFVPNIGYSPNPASPSNIRAISGHTGYDITVCGRNIAKPYVNTATGYGGRIAVTQDGLVTISGTPSRNLSNPFTEVDWDGNVYVVRFFDPTTYERISALPTGVEITINGYYLGRYHTARVRIQNTYSGETYSFYAAIMHSSETYEYTPYTGTTISVDWTNDAGTIYGGTFDTKTGILTDEWVKVTLDGTKTGNISGSYYRGTNCTDVWYDFNTSATRAKMNYGGVTTDTATSNMFIPSNNAIWGNPDNYPWEFTINSKYQIHCSFVNETVGITSDMTNTECISAINTWLASHPAEFAYLRETPITYQLSPVSLQTRFGENNVLCDAFSTLSVSYWTH